MLEESFTLVSNDQIDSNAAKTIVMAFTDKTFNQKSSNEIISYVLDTLMASCSVVPIAQKETNSDTLVATNKFLEEHRTAYINNQPKVPHVGKELDSCITTLKNISAIAPNSDIKARLDSLISKISEAINTQVKIEEKNNSRGRVMILGFIIMAGGTISYMIGLYGIAPTIMLIGLVVLLGSMFIK